ncbi:MAG TPA: FHA domain-containing protein [Candidatus Thermoplasmatota archaeon]|nr:FHA domain-containing protein [Candidatus Thermoplasmatota archaeon]
MTEPLPGEAIGESGGWEGLAGYLRAMGNAKRLHLMRFLADPHSAEEIASELGMARQTALEHVRQLEEAGLVVRRAARGRHGPVVEYVLNPSRLFAVYEAIGRLGTFEVESPELLRQPTERAGETPSRGGEAEPVRLVVVHGAHMGRHVPLRGAGPWLVGRDPTADLCLDYDPFVSGRHAEVRRAGAGFSVADALSSNGTFVDGLRVPRGGVVPAENGTILTVGRTTLVLRTK